MDMKTQVKIEDNKVIVTIGKRKVTLRGWAFQHFLGVNSGGLQYAGKSGSEAAIRFAGDCGTTGTNA